MALVDDQEMAKEMLDSIEVLQYTVPASLRMACVLASLFNVLSPWPIVFSMWKSNRDKGEIAFFTLWTFFLCNALWLTYYTFKPTDDASAFWITVVGFLFSLFYIYVHYSVSRKETRVMRFRLLAIQLALLVIWTVYFNALAPVDTRHQHAGLVCNIVNIVLLYAPLSKAGEVLRLRDSRSIPFLPAFASSLGSALWGTWGYLDNDLYMLVPGVVGVFCGAVQLALIAIFPPGRSTEAVDTQRTDGYTAVRSKHIE